MNKKESIPRGKMSQFFHKTFKILKLSQRSGQEEIKITCLWKRKVSIVIFLFVVFLVILYFLKHSILAKSGKSRKAKRHLKMESFGQEQNYKTSIQDVRIIPEILHFHFDNKQINQHQNHRLMGKESESNFQKDVHQRRKWSPKPFEPKSKKLLSDIKETQFGEKEERKRKFSNELKKGSLLSMRLKGIFVQPESKKSKKFVDKFDYSKEINNLMQKGSVLDVKGEQKRKNIFKNYGSPFQLPGGENENYHTAPKPFLPTDTQRKDPITIYLDFYPMQKSEDRFRRRKLVRTEKVFPQKKENVMSMKLVLFPKAKDLRGHQELLQKTQTDPFRNNMKRKKENFGVVRKA